VFLLDANVLITAKNEYYPIERIPEFWEWLAHMAASGAVKMPLEIWEEIAGGADDLGTWIGEQAVKDALCLDEEVDLARVQAVLNQYAPDLNDAELIKIGRDPFLIAYAAASPADRIVVTVEASKPSCQRANRRIPDVCNSMNVSWCNSFKMMKDLNFYTGWKAALPAQPSAGN
jgi:hypothetical protein